MSEHSENTGNPYQSMQVAFISDFWHSAAPNFAALMTWTSPPPNLILNQRYFAPDAAVLAINLWITTLPKTALTPPRMMAWCGRCLTAGKASTAFLKRVTVIVWQAWQLQRIWANVQAGLLWLIGWCDSGCVAQRPSNHHNMATGSEQESQSISWCYLLIDHLDRVVYTDGWVVVFFEK